MKDKIIEMKKLPSGATVIASEIKQGVGIEIGTGIILLEVDDIYSFGLFLKEIDKFFLRKP